jgi:uncharacterized protein YndB with AHSA1/START domain
MSTMSELGIEREIVIDAPVDIVWRTVTEPELIVQWFADRVELDLQPGGTGRLVFENKASKQESAARITVTAVDPPRSFSFRWGRIEDELPAEGDAVLVTFSLTPEGEERTRLRVVETGLDALDWAEDDKRSWARDHRHGWEVNLDRLAEHFTTPRG